jgi:YebC/PmpR family DNA-binding regulatory protein
MSGHSKWATIKHKKGATDAKRGKLFAKIIKQVEVAARQGGGDPDGNPTLRTMFQKARDASVPLDTIERAIKRGTGELEGVNYEDITYEGYAPAGVALLVDTLSDNRNRTGAEMRALFTKNGGDLAKPGAVSWQFSRRGIVLLSSDLDEDEIMMVALEAGAEDMTLDGQFWNLTCDPTDLPGLRDALDEAGVKYESAEASMVPSETINLDLADARSVLRMVDLLDDHDDVQDVFGNFDISDEILEQLADEE